MWPPIGCGWIHLRERGIEKKRRYPLLLCWLNPNDEAKSFLQASHTVPRLALLGTGPSSITYTRNVQQLNKLQIKKIKPICMCENGCEHRYQAAWMSFFKLQYSRLRIENITIQKKEEDAMHSLRIAKRADRNSKRIENVRKVKKNPWASGECSNLFGASQRVRRVRILQRSSHLQHQAMSETMIKFYFGETMIEDCWIFHSVELFFSLCLTYFPDDRNAPKNEAKYPISSEEIVDLLMDSGYKVEFGINFLPSIDFVSGFDFWYVMLLCLLKAAMNNQLLVKM